MNKLITSALISFGLAAVTPLAFAQVQDAVFTDGAPSGESQRHHHEKRAFSLPGERVEAKLAYIKTALKITPEQQPQWDAFANALREQAHAQDQRIQKWRAQYAKRDQNAESRRPTVVERLERRQQFMTGALETLKQRIAAEKPLYAVLTPEQQQIADEVLAPHGGHRKFERHGGGDMHHQA